MLFADFREYINVLREVFAGVQNDEIDTYSKDMLESGKKQKQAKEKLQKEIALINAKIKQLRDQIVLIEDKTEISTAIKREKEAKQRLVGKIKKRERTSRFSVLSTDTKIALCTLSVLRKYMTKEILENEFLNFPKDVNGNVLFNRKIFENSYLYADAVHIKDYITAYLQQYPDKVVSESYFNKLFDKTAGWRGICHQADKFFEDLNKEKKKKSRVEIIAESRSDLEMIKQYKADGIIFVRLKSPDALDYEGAAAHHCVGSGGYDKLIDMPNSGIYSLRSITKDGELKPAVTIELNQGVIKQVRGVCNSFIAYNYSLPARDAIMSLLDKKMPKELVDDNKITDTVLNSVGLFRDGHGGFIDIHNLSGEESFELPDLGILADGLKDYDWEKLKIGKVRILGELTEEYASEIERLEQAKQIIIEEASGKLRFNLSHLNRLQSLIITSKNGADIVFYGDNHTLETIVAKGIALTANKDLYLPSVKKMELSSMDNTELNVSLYPNIENLDIGIKDKRLLRLTGTAPHLNKMSLSGMSWQSIDMKAPEIEQLSLRLKNQSEVVNLIEFSKLKKLELRGQGLKYKINSINSLEMLELYKCQLENMDVRSFPNLKKVQIQDLDLTICGFIPKKGFDYRVENCVINQDIFSSIAVYDSIEEFRDITMKGKHFDFSQFTEILDMRNINFVEAESIKFAQKVKKIRWSGNIQPMTKIIGLEQIDDLSISIQISKDNKTSNVSLLANLDPLSVQKLDYNNIFEPEVFNISQFANLKSLSGSGVNFNDIPKNVEELSIYLDRMIIAFGDRPIPKEGPIDFSSLKKLKRLTVKSLAAKQEDITFPESIEELNLNDIFFQIKEVDLRHCRNLKKVGFELVAPKLERVYLPDSIQEIKAKYSENGIGIVSAGFEKSKLKFEIPNTAKPEIIAYLRKEWSDERVSVVAPKKEPVNKLLLLQKANNRLK